MTHIVNYTTFINEQHQEELLESINFKGLLKELHLSGNKQKIAKTIILSMLSLYSVAKTNDIINTSPYISHTEKTILQNEISEIKNEVKSPQTFYLSQNGWDHIRKYEKFAPKAYKLGDGKITIGYGHAEPVKTSKYKVGQTITEAEANKLFIKDVNIAAAGVKRIFKEWEAKGIKIKITQNQYDVLVSLAYNMGVQGLRMTDFIQEVKKGNMIKAAELIKTTGIDNNFPGLEIRRHAEYEMFISK